MKRRSATRYYLVIACGLVVSLVGGSLFSVSAERFTSSGYVIDASIVGNSLGGDSTDADYKLTSSGGESVIGQGSGGSYKLGSGYVAQLQDSIQLTVQPHGLVAYYPLDEPSGGMTAYDMASPGYNAQATVAPDRVSGQIGGAIGVVSSGSNKYLQTTETAAFDTSYVTACSWVYKTSTSTTPSIVTHSDGTASTNGMWSLGFDNGQKIQFIVRTGGTVHTLTSLNNVALNTWTHVCGAYDGTTSSVYIDGALDNSLTISGGALPAVSAPLTIGARSDGSLPADTQQIDEAKVFNTALSADEVKAEYDAGVAGDQSGVAFAGTIISGASQTALYDAIVATDTRNGYTLAVNQNQDLTSGANTIAGVSGSIAAPITWTEGVTKGLGFTLYGTNATAIDSKWSSGNAYAAFPGSATSYYTRTGLQTTKDVLNMRLRLDTATSQPPGSYTNVITTTGTMLP